jgi:TatD DNase family protein
MENISSAELKAELIDSHCHLDLIEQNNFNIEDVLKKCKESNITILQNISTNFKNFEKIYSYSEKFENVFCSIGTHPLYVMEEEWNQIEIEKKIISLKKINSIGECGLDYSKNPEIHERQIQQKYFLLQIDLASRYNLPLIIHTRNAEEDTYNFLESAYRKRENIKGVMHCFTGSLDLAKATLDLGFHISFSGIITFKKKNEYLEEIIKYTPLNRILVETDSPYLSPEPYRGQKNTPKNVCEVAKKIAELKKISYTEVANQTTINYKKLFNRSS